jgi:hypothetical protein
VTTVSDQQIGGFAERRVKIENGSAARYAAPGSLAGFAIDRDENCRASEFLYESRGDDSNHTGVPAFLCEYDSVSRVRIELRNHVPRISESCTIDFLTLSVKVFQLAGDRVRFVLVFGHEELDTTQSRADSARSIQSRAQDETNSTGSDGLSFKSRRSDHRSQSNVLSVRKHAKPISNEHAIFSTKLCNVCNRGKRDQIEHSPDEGVLALESFGERERELECDSYRGKMLVGISAVDLLRIQHRETFGQRLARQMVIGNDYVDARLAELCNRLDCTRPAITRDQKRSVSILRSAHTRL